MKRSVHLTPAARRDLEEIWEFVAADDPEAADALIDRVCARLEDLAGSPAQGAARPDLAPGVRSIVIGSYVAFYVVTPATVDVVRVANGSRDVPRLFGP